MFPSLLKSWTHALRSGSYRQGKCLLRTPLEDSTYSYCCLGVLAQIRLKELGQEWPPNDFHDPETGSYLWEGDLPGLNGLDENIAKTLAEMNDDGIPFSEIADYIEKELWETLSS